MGIAPRVGVAVGSIGSVALTLYAGRAHPSLLLKLLFSIWVLARFAGLAWANVIAKRWRPLTRQVLQFASLAVAAASLVIYAAHDLKHSGPKGAFVRVVAPPVTVVRVVVVVLIAALVSRRRSADPAR